jgi:hypothetical protein
MTAPKTRPTRDPLLRLLAINCLAGMFVAVLMVGGLLWTDTAHLWTLISTAQDPVIPIVLLAFGLMLTLGSVAMGTAIMALPYEDDKEPPTGTRAPGTTKLAYAKARKTGP